MAKKTTKKPAKPRAKKTTAAKAEAKRHCTAPEFNPGAATDETTTNPGDEV